MVVHFLLPSDTVKCRLISHGRIHLLRSKKKCFKEKALEKVRFEKVFQNKLAVLIKIRFVFSFFKLSFNKSISIQLEQKLEGRDRAWGEGGLYPLRVINSVTVNEITKDWFRFRLRAAFKPTKSVRRGNRFSFLNAGVHHKFVVNRLIDIRGKEWQRENTRVWQPSGLRTPWRKCASWIPQSTNLHGKCFQWSYCAKVSFVPTFSTNSRGNALSLTSSSRFLYVGYKHFNRGVWLLDGKFILQEKTVPKCNDK